MLPKDEDPHNLFSADKPNRKNLDACNFGEAQFIKIGESIYNLSDQNVIQKIPNGISVRMEFDRWANFDEQDFLLLGIECFKAKEIKPIVFSAIISEHSTREIENHGMTYDVVDKVCVILPDEFTQFKGQQVEVIIKVI